MALKSHYVEPMLFGYMFCVFLSMSVDQQLTYKKLCLHHFNISYCDLIQRSNNKSLLDEQNLIQKETARWGIYFDIARSAPAVLVTFFYGTWSDRVGRKVVLLLPILGDLINSLLYIVNSYFMTGHVAYLFIGIIISSFFGNVSCFISITFSYLADVTTKALRTKRIIILESMIFLGGVISNLAGGLVLQYTGFVAVYGMITTIYLCQVIYWLFLKESYTPVIADNKTKLKLLFNKVNFKDSWNLFARSSFRHIMLLYFVCYVVMLTMFTIINSVTVLYLLHQPLNFTSGQIGYFFTELNGLKFIGSLVLNYIFVHLLNWKDYALIFIAALFYCLYSLAIAVSRLPLHVYLAALFCVGIGVGTSASRAGLSKLVTSNGQGRMFSMIACVEATIVLVVSPVSKLIYEETLTISTSFVFYTMAACSLCPLILAMVLKYRHRNLDMYTDLDKDADLVDDANLHNNSTVNT